MNVFGVRVDNVERDHVWRVIRDAWLQKDAIHIATINAEILLIARENEGYRNVLCAADLNLVDAVSLHLVAWREGVALKDRYPGADLLHDVLSWAQQGKKKVFCAIYKEGLSSWADVEKSLALRYPSLDVQGCDALPQDARSVEEKIRNNASEIILCNYGAPEQELFVAHMKNAKIETMRIGIGVGGAFDFLTGAVRRAPRWMQKCGLEWLYRFSVQPQRLMRIVRAVIVFPWYVITNKSKNI